MKVGMTGTHKGATKSQLISFERELIRLEATELDSGDCVGADKQAHGIAVRLGLHTVGHIPTKDDLRAFCRYDERRAPLPYLKRNEGIVNETAVLIGLPQFLKEQLRSGTWATIRYARRLGRPVIIIAPNGDVIR